jgi:hypothetical protein
MLFCFASALNLRLSRNTCILRMEYKMLNNLKFLVLGLSLLLLSACASIMGSPTQDIPISSTPSDAAVTIKDEAGEPVFTGKTPTKVTLQKSTGKYFGKKSFVVTIAKEGYQTQTIPVTASANGLYIAGNFVFGGLIGWLVVDPLNGNMYTLSPEVISAEKSASATHNNQSKESGISIMLLQDVPENLRGQLKSVN